MCDQEPPGPGRLPLHSALHPVTADQLLSTDPAEPARAGYVDATLLGYIEAKAPQTGTLGLTRPAAVPWAPALDSRESIS